MGILRGGIAGFVTGRVGDMVFYVLNGKQVVRTVGKNVKPPTLRQLTVRMEMGVICGFLKNLVEFLNVGFGPDAADTDRNAYNAALKCNKGRALSGEYPDVVLDYSKVLVSRGFLPGPVSCIGAMVPEGLRFSWSNLPEMPYPRGNDQVMLLAYFPALGSAIYLLEAATRSQGSALLPIPADLLGERMEVYMSFVASDRKSVADSIYLGRLN